MLIITGSFLKAYAMKPKYAVETVNFRIKAITILSTMLISLVFISSKVCEKSFINLRGDRFEEYI